MNTAQTLEDEAKALNNALYAILRWDVDNVIPDELHEQARAALKPQFALADINTELLNACESALIQIRLLDPHSKKDMATPAVIEGLLEAIIKARGQSA